MLPDIVSWLHKRVFFFFIGHVNLMWSMAFYILENINDGEFVEQLDETSAARKRDWCTNMLNLAISEASKVSTNRISHGIYLVILTGLERLVIEQIPDEVQSTIFHDFIP